VRWPGGLVLAAGLLSGCGTVTQMVAPVPTPPPTRSIAVAPSPTPSAPLPPPAPPEMVVPSPPAAPARPSLPATRPSPSVTRPSSPPTVPSVPSVPSPVPAPARPPSVLSTAVEDEQRVRREAQTRIDGAERLIQGIDRTKLVAQQEENVQTIESFLNKAKEALTTQDLQRAFTLADKAYLLADELSRTLAPR